jgi:hypothetical protein
MVRFGALSENKNSHFQLLNCTAHMRSIFQRAE